MKQPWLTTLLVLAIVTASIWSPSTRAQERTDDELQRAQVEALRKQMANELHLQAFDLLDELVYAWTKAPPFSVDTAVIVADVTVPLGFGSGLEALIENHLTDLLLKHPETHARLAHCPTCSALTVHSDKTGTVVARGVDSPEALKQAGKATGAAQALFLDFEAEGSALVLRARLTTLDDQLTITFARTLSTSTTSAALLRSGDHLVSADDARQEYLDALQQRGPINVPVRLQLIQFAQTEGGGISMVPLVWVQTGAELNLSQARDWSGSLVVGGTWIPQLYSGLMLEARVNRLLTGGAVSLTHPNLYGFVGGSLSMISGPASQLLRDDIPTIADLLASATGATIQVTAYPAASLGLDLRIGNRVGAAFFVQATPTLTGSPNIGSYFDFGIGKIQSIGGEVSLWF